MEIFFNNQPLSVDGVTPEMTLLDLVNSLDEQLHDSDLVLTEIKCDGNFLSADDQEKLSQTPLAGHQKIELKAGTKKEMLLEAVGDSEEVFSHLETLNASIIENLRIGKVREAMEHLLEFFDGLDWVSTILENLPAGFAQKMQESGIEEQRVSLSRRIHEQMNSLRQSQENQDWVGSADVLEYEFAELLKECLSLFRAIQS